MEIVIELSDETYKDIKEENSIYGINNGLSARMTGKVVGAIQNGIPLPKGHWIIHPKGIYAHLICDQCLSNSPYDIRTNFCPNCGAKMVEQETKINEDISKGFEEFTRMMFRQGQEESEGTNADSN